MPDSTGSPAVAPSNDWLGGASIFDRKDERKMGRAMTGSVLAHLVLGALVLFSFVRAAQQVVQPDTDPPKVVFLEQPGPGGGGGGSPAPAPKKQLSIPQHATPPPPVPVPTPTPVVPPPTPTLNAPVITNMADVMQSQGLNAVSLASYGGGGSGGGIGSGKGNGYGPGEGGGTGGGTYMPGNGVSNPTPIHQEEPKYTSDAMRAKLQGEVWLQVVVKENGTVGDVKVTKSLDDKFGLDEEAKKAAKLWLFRPGVKDGKPVAVYATLILTFRLH